MFKGYFVIAGMEHNSLYSLSMKFSHGQHSTQTWQHLLAVLLLLFAQLATLVHASEHEFHEHSEACDIYQHAQNQSGNFLPGADPLVCTSDQFVALIPVPVDTTVSITLNHFRQRAPPHS